MDVTELKWEVFMGRLIIDDTTIYELDEECMRQKEREKKAADGVKRKETDGSAFVRDRVKEKPAP